MNPEYRLLIWLRFTLYKKTLSRWLEYLKSNLTTLPYLVIAIGVAGYFYLNSPSFVGKVISESALPILSMVRFLPFFIIFYLGYRYLTKGINYPPFKLLIGDLYLLTTPLSKQAILLVHLIQLYLLSGLGVGFLILILSPYIPLIWSEVTAFKIFIGWLSFWLYLVFLANIQWLVFYSPWLKKIAHAVKWFARIVILTLGIAVILFAVNPSLFPFQVRGFSNQTAMDVPSVPFPASLFGLTALLFLSGGLFPLVYNTFKRARLEEIINYSHFMGETARLLKGRQWEEARRLVARTKGPKKGISINIPIYGQGALAIAYKSLLTLFKQNIPLWVMRCAFLLIAFLVFIFMGGSWVKVAFVVYLFLAIGLQLSISFQQDLKRKELIRQLPVSSRQIIRGNLFVIATLLTGFGWLFVTLLLVSHRISVVEYLLSISFAPVGCTLLALAAMTAIFPESNLAALKRIIKNILGLLSFGVLGAVAVFLSEFAIPPIGIWAVVTLLGVLLCLLFERGLAYRTRNIFWRV